MTKIANGKQKSAVKPLESLRQTAFTFNSPLPVEACADAIKAIATPKRAIGDDYNQSVHMTPLALDSLTFTVTRRSHIGNQRLFITAEGTLSEMGDGTTWVSAQVRRNWWGFGLRVGGVVATVGLELAVLGAPRLTYLVALALAPWRQGNVERERAELVRDLLYAIDPRKVKKQPSQPKRKGKR